MANYLSFLKNNLDGSVFSSPSHLRLSSSPQSCPSFELARVPFETLLYFSCSSVFLDSALSCSRYVLQVGSRWEVKSSQLIALAESLNDSRVFAQSWLS